MNKKAITLVAALCTAAALCSAAVIVTAKAKGTDESSSSTISAHTIEGTVTKIKYENAQAEPVELVLNADEWKLASNELFPLNQSNPSAMLNYLKDVSATRYVGESENLSEYGLDNPSIKITITANDTETVYLIGNKNSHTGDYYFNVSGEQGVYTVGYSLVSAFLNTPEQMAQIQQPPVYSVSEVDEVEVVQSEEGFTLFGKTVPVEQDITSEPQSESSSFSESSSAIKPETERKYTIISNNTEKDIDNDSAENFLYSLNSLAFLSCVEFMPKNLSEYGLAAPSASVSVKYTKIASDNSDTAPTQQSYTLLIGGGAPDGSRYVMLKGTNMVCLADANSVSEIISAMNLE